jgi:hypothetical protein
MREAKLRDKKNNSRCFAAKLHVFGFALPRNFQLYSSAQFFGTFRARFKKTNRSEQPGAGGPRSQQTVHLYYAISKLRIDYFYVIKEIFCKAI